MKQNNFRLTIVGGTAIDMAHAGAPILVNGRPFARDASGAVVEGAAVQASAETDGSEFIVITLEGDGAELGFELAEERGYLSRGGFRGFGYKGDSDETYFAPSFPSEGSRTDERVRKLLLGDPGRAFAVVPATDAGRLTSVARVEDGQRIWAISGPAEGGKLQIRLKMDLRDEASVATERMSQALTLYNQGRWGEFLSAAERALAEFPFANKTTQRQLNELIDEVNRK